MLLPLSDFLSFCVSLSVCALSVHDSRVILAGSCAVQKKCFPTPPLCHTVCFNRLSVFMFSLAMDFTSSESSNSPDFTEGKPNFFYCFSSHRHSFTLIIMYLTELQANAILNAAYYTDRVTYNFIQYELYRTRRKAEVSTLRFNLIPGFSSQFAEHTIMEDLQSRYPLGTSLLGSVQYDLLLVDSSRESYYIFRANSNQAYYHEDSEIQFVLNYHNVHQFCEDAFQINIADLNIAFESSKVTIARVLAVVFTFVK